MTLKGSDNTASRAVMAAMRHYRKRRGMSAAALSERLAERGVLVNRAMVANQEVGRRQEVSVDQAVALAAIFGVSLDDLLSPPCEVCGSDPPNGFTCNGCGRVGAVVQPDAAVGVRVVPSVEAFEDAIGRALRRRQPRGSEDESGPDEHEAG